MNCCFDPLLVVLGSFFRWFGKHFDCLLQCCLVYRGEMDILRACGHVGVKCYFKIVLIGGRGGMGREGFSL